VVCFRNVLSLIQKIHSDHVIRESPVVNAFLGPHNRDIGVCASSQRIILDFCRLAECLEIFRLAVGKFQPANNWPGVSQETLVISYVWWNLNCDDLVALNIDDQPVRVVPLNCYAVIRRGS